MRNFLHISMYLLFVFIVESAYAQTKQQEPPIPNMPQNGVPILPQQPIPAPLPSNPPLSSPPINPATQPGFIKPAPLDSMYRLRSDTLNPSNRNIRRNSPVDSVNQQHLMPPDSLIKR
jgi:hypothetical protein